MSAENIRHFINDMIDIRRTQRGDFVLIVDFNIYLTEGKTGRKIF